MWTIFHKLSRYKIVMNNRKVINNSCYNSYLHFLCWLKESLRQASKKELVHFFEREQTSPKVTEAKERALCGGGKKSFPSRRPAGGTTQSTMQANAEAKRAWTMLSCEEKKMRSILTYSIVLSPQPCYGRRIFSFTPHVAFTSLQPTIANSNIFYYHTNHLGSTAFVTDQNQNITQGFLYAPFGEITTEYAPLWQNGTLPKYAFNAKELDEETGMFYYEARYYKPPVFTSRDAMMDQKPWLSPYHYCSNNPVGRVDPTGCDDDWWEVDGKMVWFANSDDFKNSKYEGKGEYKGKTYQKNGVYYSLFGQHMNANSTNGKITKQIDDAFIEYANYLAAEDEMFSPFDVECHDAIQELTDFSSININIPFNNSKATTGENIYYPNQMGTYAGTADIFYYVVGDKERMKRKLEGFSEGLIQSSKNGLGGPYGLDLGHYMGIYNYANSKYEKDNTIVILRFPQESDVKNLQSKFYTLFPGSKK